MIIALVVFATISILLTPFLDEIDNKKTKIENHWPGHITRLSHLGPLSKNFPYKYVLFNFFPIESTEPHNVTFSPLNCIIQLFCQDTFKTVKSSVGILGVSIVGLAEDVSTDLTILNSLRLEICLQ
jgi:hypothetical protein